MAALIPSVLSLAQGLGQTPECQNVTRTNDNGTNETTLEPMTIVPNYSVSLYFILMFALLIISTSSFTFLNYSALAKRCRKSGAISSLPKEIIKQKTPPDSEESFDLKNEDSSESLANNTTSVNDEEPEKLVRTSSQRREEFLLQTYIFFLSFICYGVLPGLQTYSTLPYGNDVFNYAVNLSMYFN